MVAIDGGKRRELGEYLGVGTNNIAELTAIDRALDLVGADAGARPVRVYTDSSYSIGVLSKGWKAKANQELIARMRRRLATLPNVEFVKVSGHAGVPENERCDELARDAITGRWRNGGDGEPGVPALVRDVPPLTGDIALFAVGMSRDEARVVSGSLTTLEGQESAGAGDMGVCGAGEVHFDPTTGDELFLIYRDTDEGVVEISIRRRVSRASHHGPSAKTETAHRSAVFSVGSLLPLSAFC